VTSFSRQAFAAFTVALAASCIALFAGVWKPYLPSVPIVVYTLFLFMSKEAGTGTMTDTLKDSPYFLGFILTMFAMFKIFNDIAFNFALFGRNPQLMTTEVGGAILSTVVGLFCRQALLSVVHIAPPEEDDRLHGIISSITSHAVAFEGARQQFFREMAEEADRRARELEAAQERFFHRMSQQLDDRLRHADAPFFPLGAGAPPSALTPAAPAAMHTPSISHSVSSAPTLPTSHPTSSSSEDGDDLARGVSTPSRNATPWSVGDGLDGRGMGHDGEAADPSLPRDLRDDAR
jgi:hypothetical protein